MKLEELVEIVGGGTPNKKRSEYWNGDIPWISVKDFKSETIKKSIMKITKLGLENSSTKLVPRGNVIIPTRMGLGKVAINEIDTAINQDLKALIIKRNDLLNLKYLFYYIQSKAEFFVSEGKGATVKGITLNTLKNLEIKLPSITIQKKIVNLLEVSHSLIDKRKQQITTLSELKQSFFYDMFGDPIENPKNWPVKSLNEVSEIEDGDRGKNYPKQQELQPDGIVFLSTSNIKNNKMIFEDLSFISNEKFSVLSKGKLKKNDLIVTLRGSIGNIAIFDHPTYNTGFINAQMAIIRVKNIRNIFFHSLYSSPSFNKYLQTIKSGSSQPQLPLRTLKQIPIILPDETTQLKFEKVINKINLNELKISNSLVQLEIFYKKLLYQAFNGQLFETNTLELA